MNRVFEWKYFLIGLIAIVLCIAVAEYVRRSSLPASPTPPAAMSSQLSLVTAYENAFNRHDLDGTMALLSENVSFFLNDLDSQFLSRQETQNAHAYFIAINGEIRLTDCQASANTVDCKLHWADDCSRAAKMNGIDEEVIFSINGDKIRKITWQSKPTAAHLAYLEFNKNLFAWLEETYPGDYAQVNAAGGWWTSETGSLLAKRCQEFASLK